MKRLDGKIALVTGAGAGIGGAIARQFSQEGATVIASDISDRTPSASKPGHGDIVSKRCDVANPEDVQRLAGFCEDRFGRLDIIVNNAGIGPRERNILHDVSLEDWDRVIGINQRGAFLVLKYCLPLVIKVGGGSVINMASVGSFTATPYSIAYLASKGALMMMTKAAALEYREHGIRVNAICPGMTRTSIMDSLSEEQVKALVARSTARMIEPEEVARLAVFLASDDSRGITGTSHVIDDGRTAGT